MIAPPPIPPAFDSAANMIIKIVPNTSNPSGGIRSLCLHSPSSHELNYLQSESPSHSSI